MNKNEFANMIYETLQLYNSFNNSKLKSKIVTKEFSFVTNIQNPKNSKKDEPQIINNNPIQNTTATTEPQFNKSDTPRNLNNKRNKLLSLTNDIFECKKCENQMVKNKRIPGTGNINAQVLILLPPRLHAKDFTERPLPIEANLFLAKWLDSIDLSPKNVFLTNITKCYFHNNITKDNINNCMAFFDSQLEIFNPSLILVLGQISISSLQKKRSDLNQFHGKIFQYKNIPYMATYDPELVMANPSLKRVVWNDLKIFKQLLDNLK